VSDVGWKSLAAIVTGLCTAAIAIFQAKFSLDRMAEVHRLNATIQSLKDQILRMDQTPKS
jgi:hypothetical protein